MTDFIADSKTETDIAAVIADANQSWLNIKA
jgi:hypothetical protein